MTLFANQKSKADPTGEARQRKIGSAVLSRRLGIAQRRITRLFKQIPTTRKSVKTIQNNVIPLFNTIEFTYNLTPAEQETFDQMIRDILNQELITVADDKPLEYYWDPVIEQPYRKGTLEEVNSLGVVLATLGIAAFLLSPEQVLSSPQYQSRLLAFQQNDYQIIKGLSNETAKQVIEQIALGVQAGNSPTAISQVIQERFSVAKSNADRIATTEINKALNDGKLDFIDQVNDDIEIITDQREAKAAVLHISALTPTTRDTHARRHGNAYTTTDQRKWWNSGANRINCLCSTRSVLVVDGKVVNTKLQKTIKAQGKAFFRSAK